MGLDELCPSVAEAVCEGRRRCCDDDSGDTGCEKSVRASCDAERADLTGESELSYDGEQAHAVREELRSGLLECEDPLPLARFFEGGKALGAACKRDSQCALGACAEGECVKPDLTLLCAE